MLHWAMYAALLVDPRAGRGEVSGGVVVELRGGIAPIQPGRPEVPSFLMLVVPNIDFRYRHRRAGVLGFGYSPRMFYRVPNQLGVQRPLFLHQLSLTYSVPLDRRWELYARTNASIGDIDYTAASLVFQGPQANLANTPVLSFAIGDAELRFVGRIRPRHTITFATTAGYRIALDPQDQPIQGPGGMTNAPLLSYPNQRAGYLGLGYSYAASRRDQISITSYNGVIEFDPGGIFVSNDGRVGWNHQIRRRVLSEIDAGALSAQVVSVDPGVPVVPRSKVQPVGNARISGRLRSRARYTLDGSIGATYTGFFDAVRGQLSPRAGGSVTLTAAFPPRWSVGLISSLFTPATARPLPPIVLNMATGQSVPQTETIILNQIPIRYRVNDEMSIEFGAIANFRMPHLAAGTTAGTQVEAWGYVAFRIAGGTARGGREVATRGVGTGQGAATGAGGVGRR